MPEDNSLSGDNAVMEFLKSSPLNEDRAFKECVESADIDGAVARSKELVQSSDTSIRMKLVAESLPPAVIRIRSVAATASEEVSITRARYHLS